MLTLGYTLTEEAVGPSGGSIGREGVLSLTVGSAPGCDLGEGNASLDPHHARLDDRAGRLTLTVEGTGITQVDDAIVSGTVDLQAGSTVRLGGLRIEVHDDRLDYRDVGGQWLVGRRRARDLPEELLLRLGGEGGVQIDARHLRKRVSGGIDLLQDISLRVRPRELVILVGLSGAGKTTLLNALCGYSPATDGQVLLDGADLYANFDRFRPSIGFVPQQNIIHGDLTVYEAFDYAARLRLPPHTSQEARRARIDQVLDDLDLGARRDVRVRSLSGGQQKRVSIGVELITSPQLFFLDEPTSGLDPGTETGLMQLLRRLADGGRTVVIITHATGNVMLADKLLFMVRGGHVAWYGPPKEALAYFQRSRPPIERENGDLEFDAVYSLLDDPERGSPPEWGERYRQDSAYARYIEAPLHLAETGPPEAPRDPPEATPQISALQQFVILLSRNLRLLTRDRIALVLTLVAAPLLASLDFLITARHMYDPTLGDPLRATIGGTTLAIDGVFVGALSQAREIIKDRDIYRRERLVNLKIAPYIFSKVAVAIILAFYQAAAWVGVRYLAVQMPGGFDTALSIYLTVLLTVIAGMMLGLLASAVAPTEEAVTTVVALFIVPQILFNGSFMPLPELGSAGRVVTTLMASRWSFETVMTQSRMGLDLRRDLGWRLSREQRATLTPAQTSADRCLGIHIFTECTFPGIRAYARPAVLAPPPTAPHRPSAATSAAHRAVYRTAYIRYRRAYTTWQSQRAAAIAGAEAVLDDQNVKYGAVYDVNVPWHWGILAGMSGIVILMLLGIQRLRDRR
jgi:ABC-type multidrug transport system ATPase subunit